MSNIAKRIKYSPRRTRRNIPIVLPLVGLFGGALGLWLLKDQLADLLGGKQKVARVVPPLLAAGASSFLVKPKVGPKIGEYLDYTSLGLVSVAALAAVWPTEEEKFEKEMTKLKTEEERKQYKAAQEKKGKQAEEKVMLKARHGLDGKPEAAWSKGNFGVFFSAPTVGWLLYDDIPFAVQRLSGGAVPVYWRLEGRKGWDQLGQPIGTFDWGGPIQGELKDGLMRKNDSFSDVVHRNMGSGKYQYRIVLSRDRAGKERYLETPWYNWSSYYLNPF